MPDKPEYTPKRAPRVDAHLRAVVTAGPRRSVPFMIDSMSVTGARLTGPLTLAKGQVISVTFTAEGRSVTIEVEVVRVDTADLMNDQVAVQFKNVGDDEKQAIHEFVRHRLEEEEAQAREAEFGAQPDAEATTQGTHVEPDAEVTGDTETIIEAD